MATRAEDVERFAASLPEAALGQHGHRPAYRVGKRLFLVVQDGGEEVLVWVDDAARAEVFAGDPPGFETILRKDGTPVKDWISVDLRLADPALARETVEDAWRHHAPKRALAARDR